VTEGDSIGRDDNRVDSGARDHAAAIEREAARGATERAADGPRHPGENTVPESVPENEGTPPVIAAAKAPSPKSIWIWPRKGKPGAFVRVAPKVTKARPKGSAVPAPEPLQVALGVMFSNELQLAPPAKLIGERHTSLSAQRVGWAENEPKSEKRAKAQSR
jgi:hypothetical protein